MKFSDCPLVVSLSPASLARGGGKLKQTYARPRGEWLLPLWSAGAREARMNERAVPQTQLGPFIPNFCSHILFPGHALLCLCPYPVWSVVRSSGSGTAAGWLLGFVYPDRILWLRQVLICPALPGYAQGLNFGHQRNTMAKNAGANIGCERDLHCLFWEFLCWTEVPTGVSI